jgi:hypothetical protein
MGESSPPLDHINQNAVAKSGMCAHAKMRSDVGLTRLAPAAAASGNAPATGGAVAQIGAPVMTNSTTETGAKAIAAATDHASAPTTRGVESCVFGSKAVVVSGFVDAST